MSDEPRLKSDGLPVQPRWKTGKTRGGKRSRARRENLGPWRQAVVRRDLHRCQSCGYRGQHLSAHHLMFLSHCEDRYRRDIRNGLTLCNDLAHSLRRGCHERLHAGKLKVRRAWLRSEVVECLAEQGLTWDAEGVPHGPCAKYFAPEKEHSDAGDTVGG